MNKNQLQEVGKNAVRRNAGSFPPDPDTVKWMWVQVNAAIDAVVQASLSNHAELVYAAADEQAATIQAAHMDLDWARQVLADAGANVHTQRLRAISALREAHGKKFYLHAYVKVVDRLREQDLAEVRDV